MSSLLLVAGGTGLATFALASLGRSMSILPEARVLVTSGPYATVRRPIYVGELIALCGISLQYLSPWALLLLVAVAVLQFARLINEERVLAAAFPEYQDYVVRTARLLPHLY